MLPPHGKLKHWKPTTILNPTCYFPWFPAWNDHKAPLYKVGMVQASVGHFVTPLKCMYDEYDWRVTSQTLHKKHKQYDKQHHHGVGVACPSSGTDLMNPCHLRGGRPCACLFQGRRRSDFIDSINKVEINLFILASSLIEFGLVHRRQWWPKLRPLSAAAANKIRVN